MSLRRDKFNASCLSNSLRFTAMTVSAALLPLSAMGAEVSWAVDAGVAHSDNARLTESDEISDQLMAVGGQLVVERETRRLRVAFDGEGNYIHYRDGTFDNDFVARATGSAVLGIVPDRILWTFNDTFGQVAVNELQAITPNNRQWLNHFSTGPDFILSLTDQVDLRAEGRFGISQYENARQADTRTWGGTLRLVRNVSRSTSLELAASQNRVDYDIESIQDSDYQSVYGRISTVRARQTLTLDVGANRVDLGETDNINPLVRMNWARRITPSWGLNIGLRSEYQTFTQRFTADAGGDLPGTGTSRLVETPTETYSGNVMFTFERPRTRVAFGGEYTTLDYKGLDSTEENYWGVRAEINRRLTPQLQAFATYRFYQNDYGDIEDIDAVAFRRDRHQATAGLDWLMGRRTALTFGYGFDNSSGNRAEVRRYTQNMLYMQLSYRRGEGMGPRVIAY